MNVELNRTAFEMRRIFVEATEEDRKHEDDLMTYFRLHYQYIFCSNEETAYHVGEIYYDSHEDVFWVVTGQIDTHILMVELKYDINGNLVQPDRHCSLGISRFESESDPTVGIYEYLGTYRQYIDDDEFRKMVYLRYYKNHLEQLADINAQELEKTNEVLAMNPHDRRIYDIRTKKGGI